MDAVPSWGQELEPVTGASSTLMRGFSIRVSLEGLLASYDSKSALVDFLGDYILEGNRGWGRSGGAGSSWTTSEVTAKAFAWGKNTVWDGGMTGDDVGRVPVYKSNGYWMVRIPVVLYGKPEIGKSEYWENAGHADKSKWAEQEGEVRVTPGARIQLSSVAIGLPSKERLSRPLQPKFGDFYVGDIDSTPWVKLSMPLVLTASKHATTASVEPSEIMPGKYRLNGVLYEVVRAKAGHLYVMRFDGNERLTNSRGKRYTIPRWTLVPGGLKMLGDNGDIVERMVYDPHSYRDRKVPEHTLGAELLQQMYADNAIISESAAGQWKIDGLPYRTGEWIEVRGLHIFDDDGPFPCRRVVGEVAGKYAWEVYVPVGFGPNSGKVLTGTAKTLEAAKDKAMAATKQDDVANNRYSEQVKRLVGSKTAQREGDTTRFGKYRLVYTTQDMGEQKPRHVITAYDGELKVGELNWYGKTGTIHHIEVEPEYLRQGIATAMWEWGQTMRPAPKHSADRTTQGDAWARQVGGTLPRRMAAKTAAVPRLYRSFGDSHEKQYREAEPRLFISAVKTVSDSFNTYALADVLVPWNGDLHRKMSEVTTAAKSAFKTFPIKLDGYTFVLWGGGKGESQSKIIGISKTIGSWGRPVNVRGIADADFRLSEVMLGSADKDEAWEAWLTGVANMSVPGKPTHPGVAESDTKITVYRGVSLGPKDDPTAGKVFVGDTPSSAMGSSWTTSLEVAKSIAERGMAGFDLDNSPGRTHWVRPGDGPNNRSYDHKVDRIVPTVLRAEVVLGENASLYEGLGGYRYLSAEQEVDIPRGTEFTLTGWMQADEIAVDPAAEKKAWKQYQKDVARKKKDKEEGYDEAYWKERYSDRSGDQYEVTYRWGKWNNVKIKRTAAAQTFWHWSFTGQLYHPWLHAGTKAAALERKANLTQSPGDVAPLVRDGVMYELRVTGPTLNTPSTPISDNMVMEGLEDYGAGAKVPYSGRTEELWRDLWKREDPRLLENSIPVLNALLAGRKGAIFYVNGSEDEGSISVYAPKEQLQIVNQEHTGSTLTQRTAVDKPVRIGDIERKGDSYIGVVQSGIGYRAIGSWKELRDAIQQGWYRSEGTYTTSIEGRTQFSTDMDDVLGWNGGGGRGYDYSPVAVIEVDLAGLKFRVGSPIDEGTQYLSGDTGLGIGIDGRIPLSAIRAVHEIDSGQVVQTWRGDWKSAVKEHDSGDISSRPEVMNDWATWRVWVTTNKSETKLHRALNGGQYATACAGTGDFKRHWLEPLGAVCPNGFWDGAGGRVPLSGIRDSKGKLIPLCDKCWREFIQTILMPVRSKPRTDWDDLEMSFYDRSVLLRLQQARNPDFLTKKRKPKWGSKEAAATGRVAAFFHGTDADLRVGDVLVPGKEVGKDNWDREEFSEDFVWMLDSPEYASVYGKHLYEVEPIGEVMNFSEENGHTDEMESEREWEYVAPKARIVRKLASGPVVLLGKSPLKYDYVGTVQRIAIIDQSAEPSKPGWTYFTTDRVEDNKSRKRRSEWDEGRGTTQRKPAPKYKEGTGTAEEGMVAFLDFIEQPNQIFIAFLNVRDDYRGRGLAKQLVDWVYAKARRDGKQFVDWGTVFYPANQMYWKYEARTDLGVTTVGRPLDRRISALHHAAGQSYWRVHDPRNKFSPENAASIPLTDRDETYGDPRHSMFYRPGYSAMENPWHLWAYLIVMGWIQSGFVQNNEVIEFSGREVTRADFDKALRDAPSDARDWAWGANSGRGLDGEVTVIPDMNKVRRMSWSDFTKMLVRTPFPHDTGDWRNSQFKDWGQLAAAIVERGYDDPVSKLVVERFG